MSTLTNNVVSIDVDNTENWTIQVNDTDLEGNPISHAGDQLLAVIKDGQGETVFEAESGDELSIAGGTDNGIVLSVPWSVVKDLPPATYYASLVVVTDENNRTKIIDLELRHSHL